MGTDDGRQALAVCQSAPGPCVEPVEPTQKADPLPSLKKVREKAVELRKAKPALTEYQARAQVWKQNPDLRRGYDAERAAEIREARAV